MMNAQIETLGEMASATLQASVAYELESAIASTVALVKESEGHLAERLSRHLDDLLAEQLRQVSVAQEADEAVLAPVAHSSQGGGGSTISSHRHEIVAHGKPRDLGG